MADSSPDTPKPATGYNSLSAREAEILSKAWNCLKSGPPEIDYPKLAGEIGMTNHRSAMNAWGAIKKKMQWAAGETPAGAASASKATASGKRKKPAAAAKNKAADNSDDDDAAEVNDGAAEATPSKKAKTTGRGKAATKTPKKEAATPRKPKTPAKVKEEVVEEVVEETSDTEMKDTENGKIVKTEAGDEADKEPETKPVKNEGAEQEEIDAV